MTPERREELESALLRGLMQCDAKTWARKMRRTLPGDDDETTDAAIREERRRRARSARREVRV